MGLFSKRKDNQKLRRINSYLSDQLQGVRSLLSSDLGHKDITSDILLNYKWNDPATLTIIDFKQIYRYNPVAAAVIDKPAEQTWKKPPLLITKAERQKTIINDLAKTLSLYTKFKKADKNAHIGEFAVIVLGFPGLTETPVERSSILAWVQTYDQTQATIETYEKRREDPRYGQPLTYRITSLIGDTTESIAYHWTRVLHISRDGEIKSEPYLRSIYNTCKDAMKISGAGAESLFRAAAFILGVEVDKESPLLDQGNSYDLLGDENQNPSTKPLMEILLKSTKAAKDRGHGVVIVQGGKLKSVQSHPSDPTGTHKVTIGNIAMKTEYPQRMWTGNEAGELASTQDRDSLNDTTRTRQNNFAIPYILNAFIARLIAVKFLQPFDYLWKFDVLAEPSKLEIANTNKLKSETMRNIVQAFTLGLGEIVTEEEVKKLYPNLFTFKEDNDG